MYDLKGFRQAFGLTQKILQIFLSVVKPIFRVWKIYERFRT